MALLILYLSLALTFSFLCSLMEAVLLSTPISFLFVKQEKAYKSASRLIAYKKNVDRPLSAILSLNTVAHTVGAAGVGAQAVKVFGEASFGIVSALLTLLILVLTEIIPKTIGARYWRNLTVFVSHSIKYTMILTYPLVLISSLITRVFSGQEGEKTTSREEFSVLANIGKEEGIFGDKEHKIIHNVLRLKTIRVSEIMTPRVVVSSADEAMPLSEFKEHKTLLHFSRIPVYEESPDNITGYIFRQQVFESIAEDEDEKKLREIKREIMVVHERSNVFNIWDKMLKAKEHIALVVDEYGGIEGIITMEDIIESLLGFEIVDEKDTVADMQQYARERWSMRQKKYNFLNSDTTGEETPL